MVMSVQPIVDSIKAVKKENKGKVIFLGPKGKTFNQNLAKRIGKRGRINIFMWSL